MPTTPPEQSLSREAFAVFFGNAVTALSNLIIGMILVRHFTDKSVFATYSQTMFLAATLVAFIPLGLHRAIIYFFPRVESQRAFAVQTFLMISLLMLITGAGMFLLRDTIGSWFNNKGLTKVILYILGIMWMQNFNSILQQVLLATQRARLLGAVLAVTGILNLLAISISASYGLDLPSMLGVIILVSATQAGFTILTIFRLPGRLSAVLDTTHIKNQVAYSFPLALGSFTGVIGKTLDRFIIMSYFPPAIFAVYDRGAIELPFISQLPYSANSVLQPRLTVLYKEGDYSGFLLLWHKAVRKLALVMLPIMVFTWILAKQIIIVVNTASYTDSAMFFKIYILLIPLQITVYTAILMSTGHTMRIFLVTTIALVLNLALNIVSVKVFRLGPMGPAVSTVAVEGIKSAFFLYIIGKSLDTSFSRIYPWLELKRIFLLSVLSGAIVYPLTMLKFAPLTQVILCMVVFGVIYTVTGWKSGVLRQEDYLDIKQMAGLRAA